MPAIPTIWIFNGDGARFPGGTFSTRARAEAWIAEHRLSGVLTAYPLDRGVFDWALAEGRFTPKEGRVYDPAFIGGFTTASQDHVHFVDGRPDSQG
jgi:hypothetical protein